MAVGCRDTYVSDRTTSDNLIPRDSTTCGDRPSFTKKRTQSEDMIRTNN